MYYVSAFINDIVRCFKNGRLIIYVHNLKATCYSDFTQPVESLIIITY